jgi:hypothetical protein
MECLHVVLWNNKPGFWPKPGLYDQRDAAARASGVDGFTQPGGQTQRHGAAGLFPGQLDVVAAKVP